LDTSKLEQIREETDVVLKAYEDWAERYYTHGKNFKKLVKNYAKIERIMNHYFKKLEKQALQQINWDEYEKKVNG
jgi:hypothetical protein